MLRACNERESCIRLVKKVEIYLETRRKCPYDYQRQ